MNKRLFRKLMDEAENSGIPFETFMTTYKSKIDSASNKSQDIYLVRHGDVSFSQNETPERIRSVIDLPLSETGLIQANSTGIELRNSGIECIYSSDMLRALQTSRGIQLNCNAIVEQLSGFRSWNLGSLAGKLSSEVEKQTDELVNNPDTLPPGSNESYNIFKNRNIETYEKVIRSGGIIAIVTHYSNCRLILEHLGCNKTELLPGEAYKL